MFEGTAVRPRGLRQTHLVAHQESEQKTYKAEEQVYFTNSEKR